MDQQCIIRAMSEPNERPKNEKAGKPPAREERKPGGEKEGKGEEEGLDLPVAQTLLNQLLYVLGIEDLRRERWRLVKLNFLMGLARGLGFFLGATIIGAMVFWLILRLVDAPLIGGFISEILEIVKGTAK